MVPPAMHKYAADTSDERLAHQYSRMYLIRSFEAAAEKLWRKGDIRGAMHLSDGQEAVAVGTCSILADGDVLCATYRGHAWALAWGLCPAELFGELLGRENGCLRGRGGSKHLGDWTRNMLPGNAIVGGQLPVAAGMAFAGRFLSEGSQAKHLTVVVLGDGALNQGTLQESLSLASLWKLPLVLICENNLYSELTVTASVMPTHEIQPRIESYGVAYRRCDGMDVTDVANVISEAAAYARDMRGPVFVEAFTYRFCGHHTGDAERYRSAAEVESWRQRDPLGPSMLAQSGIEPRAGELRLQADQLVQDAIEEALAAPFAVTPLDYSRR